MPRPTRQQIDDEIIDTAATLFARHGFAETSIQRIADAVGYSKGGLLRHYPSKDVLQDAVIARCLSEIQAIVASAADQEPGPRRDREVLASLAHLAIRRPGFFALMLAALVRGLSNPETAPVQPITDVVAEAFSLTPDTDLVRIVRVAGALGALAVARTALGEQLTTDSVDHLIDVSYDALGCPDGDHADAGHRRQADQ
jgi:AcrR family transcriptional regulator